MFEEPSDPRAPRRAGRVRDPALLEDPLAEDELRDLGQRLGRAAVDYADKQAEFAEAGLTKDSSDEEILSAMANTPILMERPVVIRGDRTAIGRPPEDVLALL